MIGFYSAGAMGTDGGGSGGPPWSNVSALLHFDGADGSTTFTDEKGNSWAAMNSARIETDFYKFGGASGWFENVTGGSGDGSSRIQTADNPAFRFGTGDFTVEGWFRPQTPAMGFGFFFRKGANSASGLSLAVTPTSMILRANGTTDSTASVSLSTSAWSHLAFVREGTTIRFFANGVSMGTATRSFDHTSLDILSIGSASGDGRFAYKGMIDELRITKGLALYSSNFTPPSAPFPNS